MPLQRRAFAAEAEVCFWHVQCRRLCFPSDGTKEATERERERERETRTDFSQVARLKALIAAAATPSSEAVVGASPATSMTLVRPQPADEAVLSLAMRGAGASSLPSSPSAGAQTVEALQAEAKVRTMALRKAQTENTLLEHQVARLREEISGMRENAASLTASMEYSGERAVCVCGVLFRQGAPLTPPSGWASTAQQRPSTLRRTHPLRESMLRHQTRTRR